MTIKIDTTVPELEPWGSVTNLGSEVLEGDVHVTNTALDQGLVPEGQVLTGEVRV